MSFLSTGVLWEEGIGLLTGPAGKGKTNLLLAAATSMLKEDKDFLGFKIHSTPALYVDTENQLSIFHRNIRRSLINRSGLSINESHEGIDFINIRQLETWIEKQNWFFSIIILSCSLKERKKIEFSN